jgi:conjugative relaxase-like TrwC/TraI family protein
MMSFSAVGSAEYYIDLAKEDYYLKGGEPSGQWHGLGAALLGISGIVEDEDFHRLMNGLHPSSKQPLYQQHGQKHRAGYDLVFNAPKSVSLLWARAPIQLKKPIQKLQEIAVKRALDELELRAAYTRRGHNGIEHQKIIGLTAALFEHSTSREVDPHLHTHAVICNVAPRIDGSFGTLESRYLLIWQKMASSVYKACLSDGLRELGFDTIQVGDSFEVKDISEPLLKHYSKRSLQMKDAMDAKGVSGSRAANLAARLTRSEKGTIDRSTLSSKWQSEFDKKGFTSEYLEGLQRKSLGMHFNLDSSVLENSNLIVSLGQQLVTTQSVFTESQVFDKALKVSISEGLSVSYGIELAEQFLSSELFIELEPQNKFTRLFTTKEMIKIEHRLIRFAQILSQTHSKKLALSDQELISAQTKLNIVLSEEQFEAVLGVSGEQNFQILSGSAGAGKSKAMSVVKQALSEKNIKVYGAAIAKSAANSLQLETGIKSKTVAMTLIEMEHERSSIKKGDVLIIDEAGQLGVKQALKLLGYASSIGFKVILVGEDKQLEAIDHGGVFSYLSRPDVIGTARIETIRRQNHEWDRKAVANYRDGFAKQALEQYKAHHRLHISDQAQNAQQQLVDDWWLLKNSHNQKDTMVLARTWRQVTSLNLLVRSRLQENGLIGKEDLDIAGVVNNRSISYNLSLNERLRFTENDNRLGFTNGDVGTVVNIDISKSGTKTFTIRRDDGIEVIVNQQNYSDRKGRLYLVPAYAQTIYSSQGRTIDGNVYVLHDSGIDRKNAYVSMSRHKEQCHLYASIEEVLDIENADPHKDYSDKVIENLAKQYSTERSASLAISYPVLEQSKDLAPELVIEPEYSF